jgi:hypothetical protein
MPPFLYNKEEAKRGGVAVRYVLAASEDLNKVIKNVRACFGFPYPDAIGFFNAVNSRHRARREHEGLIDRLRTWAIVGNVDAIVWIDFEKAQRDKVGPRDSVPFSERHLNVITDGAVSVVRGPDTSEAEDDEALDEIVDEERVSPRGREGFLKVIRATQGLRDEQTVLLNSTLAIPNRGCAFPGEDLEDHDGDEDEEGRARREDEEQAPTEKETGAPADQEAAGGEEEQPAKDWKAEVPTLQPETKPPIGCIYPRSMTPGPGSYYHVLSWKTGGIAFQRKPRGRIDELVREKAADPAPGQYEGPLGMTERILTEGAGADRIRGVRFSNAARLRLAVEGPNSSPLVTKEHAKSANAGIYSPGYFHDVLPGAQEEQVLSKYRKQHAHTIGRAKRM